MYTVRLVTGRSYAQRKLASISMTGANAIIVMNFCFISLVDRHQNRYGCVVLIVSKVKKFRTIYIVTIIKNVRNPLRFYTSVDRFCRTIYIKEKGIFLKAFRNQILCCCSHKMVEVHCGKHSTLSSLPEIIRIFAALKRVWICAT